MSSINIFMDKKIKKYSWIHELNAAAMKAKLLNEAEQYTKHQQFLTEQHYTKQKNLNESNEKMMQGILNLFRDVGAEYPKTRRGADALRNFQPMGLDVEGEEDESGMGYPNPSGVESFTSPQNLDPSNSDMDGDGRGTANEVAMDGADGEIGDRENLGKMAFYPWAHQAGNPPPSAPVPPARFPSGMAPNAITKLGTEDAVRRGIIPQSHVARTETRRLQALQNEMAAEAARRAKSQAQKEGKLPTSANAAGIAAGNQAIQDFKSNLGLEGAARGILLNNPPTGSRPTEDDLRRIAGMFGRGV
jgi:hypothetical protein